MTENNLENIRAVVNKFWTLRAAFFLVYEVAVRGGENLILGRPIETNVDKVMERIAGLQPHVRQSLILAITNASSFINDMAREHIEKATQVKVKKDNESGN